MASHKKEPIVVVHNELFSEIRLRVFLCITKKGPFFICFNWQPVSTSTITLCFVFKLRYFIGGYICVN